MNMHIIMEVSLIRGSIHTRVEWSLEASELFSSVPDWYLRFALVYSGNST